MNPQKLVLHPPTRTIPIQVSPLKLFRTQVKFYSGSLALGYGVRERVAEMGEAEPGRGQPNRHWGRLQKGGGHRNKPPL